MSPEETREMLHTITEGELTATIGAAGELPENIAHKLDHAMGCLNQLVAQIPCTISQIIRGDATAHGTTDPIKVVKSFTRGDIHFKYELTFAPKAAISDVAVRSIRTKILSLVADSAEYWIDEHLMPADYPRSPWTSTGLGVSFHEGMLIVV